MSLKDDVLSAWAEARPLTDAEALDLALTILDAQPKARGQFREWLDSNIEYARTLYG